MKRLNFIIIALVCLCTSGYSQISIGEKGKAQYYNNPILTGMNPDPSICRVGEDYYLVTSTFGFYPGLPVYNSRDLVHWELIGNGIDRPSQLNTQENERFNLFAPTIRYNNGVFYIIDTRSLFIVPKTAKIGNLSRPGKMDVCLVLDWELGGLPELLSECTHRPME